uniref:Uncharacterized protein n=1 Tax=Anthurium amnicola TaxID=1678845 RepID=A0A1D1YT10_9ARAE
MEDPKTYAIPLPIDMHDYFSSTPFTTCTFIEFLRQLDLEQKLKSTEQRSIHGIYAKFLNSLSINQDIPQFARDHAKKLLKELSTSKEVVSFWDSIVEREKHRATEEHDYKLLEQVRSKHVSIGDADVARVQRENKVDGESLKASTEKKRKDEDGMASTLSIKRSRSSYSPSPSEVEELPSLVTDSDDDIEEKEVLSIIEYQNSEPRSENKIRTSACNENDEESSSSPPNQELGDTETIPPIIVNEDGDIMTDTKIMRERYLKILRDLNDYCSKKDWLIDDYNVSDEFRKYQIININKLLVGETFNFASDGEAILSLHNIMFIDLTTMKKPLYLDIDDERKWRISIRHPKQQTPPSFLGEIMNEYEAEINDIDELRFKFYDMWEKYRDKVIYSDNERRLFEAIQAVARAL